MNPTGTLRTFSIFSLIAIFIATAFMAGARPAEALTNCTVSAADLTFDSEEQSFLRLLNDYRAQNGAGPLTASVNLNRAAAWMANDMVNRTDAPSHIDTLGRDPFVRMADCDASPPGAGLAENIAGGPTSTGAEILAQWKTSPSHDATMKRADLKQIGIARDFNANNQFPWQWATDFQTVDDGTNMLAGPQSQPLVSFESPPSGNVTSTFQVSGWAIDRGATQNDGIDLVQVIIYPADANGNPTGAQVFFSATNFPQPRSDVANIFGAQFMGSGFSATTTALPPGKYQVVVNVHSVISNAWTPVPRVVTVTGPASTPLVAIDSPQPGTIPGVIDISGWAIDKAATSGTGVDQINAYVYPSDGKGNTTGAQVFFAQAKYGGDRPDVGNAYGAQFRFSGYTTHVSQLQAGTYLVRIYSHSTVSSSWTIVDRNVQVLGPLLAIDTPTNSNQNPVSVSGWAIDRAAVSNSGVDYVHVYVYPANASGQNTGAYVYFATAPVNGSRPDVASFYGSQYRISGFSQPLPTLANGFYNVTVYVHSTISNSYYASTKLFGVGMSASSAADSGAPREPQPVAGSGSTSPGAPPEQPPVPAPPPPAATPQPAAPSIGKNR